MNQNRIIPHPNPWLGLSRTEMDTNTDTNNPYNPSLRPGRADTNMDTGTNTDTNRDNPSSLIGQGGGEDEYKYE